MRRKLWPTAERTTLASSPGRSTWSPAVVGDDGSLHAELVRRAGLALADALDLRSMEGIQLPAALALLLQRIWVARLSGRANASSSAGWPSILRRMSRMIRPSRLRRIRNCRRCRLNCLAWA